MFAPLSLGALLIVMITAPIHYAFEYPILTSIILVLLAVPFVVLLRWVGDRRAARKLMKHEKKIALYQEAVRRESARDVA